MRAHLFEEILSVSREDLWDSLTFLQPIPWLDFELNPRRLRGSDFLMRWSQGVWSEKRICHAVNRLKGYFALEYGPSGVAPDGNPRAFELYFERLEKAGKAKIKRPDLLIFPKSKQEAVKRIVERFGGKAELPFIAEKRLSNLLSMAIMAVECENSLWRAKKMPRYGCELRPQRRLKMQLGVAKTAVLPNIIIKDEDLPNLRNWQRRTGVKVHIWQVFFDLAFGMALDTATRMIRKEAIVPNTQVYQAPGGATTNKDIYRFPYHFAYELGKVVSEPRLRADVVEDKNGHILPYVRFDGGNLSISRSGKEVLEMISHQRR